MNFITKIWHHARNFYSRHSKLVLAIGGILLVFYVFIPQLGSLKESLMAVESANKKELFLAVVVFCCGFPILALKYCLIAQYKLRYMLTFQVQIASAFVSKLLPMSIGSLTVNTYYLTTQSKSVAKAASTMTLNALTSSAAFALIVIAALAANSNDLTFKGNTSEINWYRILGLIVVISVIIWLLSRIGRLRKMITNAWNGLWTNFKTYREQPIKATWGVIFNGLGSMTGITTLLICARATGLPVTLPQAVLSYTMGNIIGSLVPTPGGLGGVEAGLYAGLVFFGYDQNTSLTAVLLYRLITYWIPIIPGYMMYRRLRATVLSDFHIHQKKVESATA